MIKRITILALLTTVACVAAIAQEKISFEKPKMTVFLPEKSKSTGRAVVILPGGGYVNLAVDNEGLAWAPYFNDQGIAAIVLEYTMPGGNPQLPFGDVEKAMEIIHENAVKWHIDKSDIGIMGFSAGGHLASTFATHCHSELAPAFQILFYPVITMDKRFTHAGSRLNLLGENPSKELETLYSNEKQVAKSTPRAIILLSDGDDVVPTENSTAYYDALARNHVHASLHIYPTGWHGFGFDSKFRHHKEMLADLSAWLSTF